MIDSRMSVRFQLDTLLHYDPNRSTATVHVWIAHPSPSDESALGKIMILSSLDRLTRVNHEVLNLLQEEIKTQYYQATDTAPDRAFERALQQTNERLHEVIGQGIDDWVAGANILIAAFRQQSVFFSHVGQMNAYLVRQQRLHPLIAAGDRVEPNPLRMFSQVISGSAEVGDRFILSSPSLFDYFSLEKIRRLVMDSHPDEVVRQLEATILGAEPTYGLGAIVLEAEAADHVVIPAHVAPTVVTSVGRSLPETSMETMLSRQRQTEKILTPSMWPAVVDVVRRLSQLIQSFVRVIILRRQPKRKVPFGLRAAPLTRNRPTVRINLNQTWLKLRSFIQRLHVSFRRTPAVPHEPEIAFPTASDRRPSRWIHALVAWFQRLRPLQRGIIGVAVVLIIALTTAVVQGGVGRTTSRTGNPEQQIRNLISQAQAALLYGGNQTATTAVAQADSLLNQLPHRTKAQRATLTSLQTSLATLHGQLDHLTTVTTSPTVLDLSGLNGLDNPRQLYLLGSSLVAFDPSSGSAAVRQVSGSGPAAVVADTLDTGTPTTGAVSTTTSLIFSTDRQTFTEFDISTKQWRPIDSSWPQPSPEIKSLATFQGRLYALDTYHQDIVRFVRGGNSLGTGSSWLKTTALFSAARGLAIDGTIFVLQPNGKVEQWNSGRKTSFALAIIHPTLTNITRIWTDLNSTYLYLLEPNSQRLVVVDKTGQVVDQYQSSDWTDLRDLSVNEKKKTAYLLTGTKVVSVTLKH